MTIGQPVVAAVASPKIAMSRGRTFAVAALILAELAALPFALTKYQVGLATEMLIYGMLAMSIDILAGFSGRTHRSRGPHRSHLRARRPVQSRHRSPLSFSITIRPGCISTKSCCRRTSAGGAGISPSATPASCPPSTSGRWPDVARRLTETGVAVTVIPATDLFLMGRDHDHNVPRGVTPAHRLAAHQRDLSLATHNVLNPFTPFGDCSLIRMANLYANIAQVGRTSEVAALLDLVTTAPAKLMNLEDYGIAIGNPADIVVLEFAECRCRSRGARIANARAQAGTLDIRAARHGDQLAKELVSEGPHRPQ